MEIRILQTDMSVPDIVKVEISEHDVEGQIHRTRELVKKSKTDIRKKRMLFMLLDKLEEDWNKRKDAS